MKVDLYVCGRYRGEREVSEQSLIGSLVRMANGDEDAPRDLHASLLAMKSDLEVAGSSCEVEVKE